MAIDCLQLKKALVSRGSKENVIRLKIVLLIPRFLSFLCQKAKTIVILCVLAVIYFCKVVLKDFSLYLLFKKTQKKL